MASYWSSIAFWYFSGAFISARIFARPTKANAYSTLPVCFLVYDTTSSMTYNAYWKWRCFEKHCAFNTSILTFLTVSLLSRLLFLTCWLYFYSWSSALFKVSKASSKFGWAMKASARVIMMLTWTNSAFGTSGVNFSILCRDRERCSIACSIHSKPK